MGRTDPRTVLPGSAEVRDGGITSLRADLDTGHKVRSAMEKRTCGTRLVTGWEKVMEGADMQALPLRNNGMLFLR